MGLSRNLPLQQLQHQHQHQHLSRGGGRGCGATLVALVVVLSLSLASGNQASAARNEDDDADLAGTIVVENGEYLVLPSKETSSGDFVASFTDAEAEAVAAAVASSTNGKVKIEELPRWSLRSIGNGRTVGERLRTGRTGALEATTLGGTERTEGGEGGIAGGVWGLSLVYFLLPAVALARWLGMRWRRSELGEVREHPKAWNRGGTATARDGEGEAARQVPPRTERQRRLSGMEVGH
jgi:hypothetical protein